jgi:predicted peptidase
VILAGFSYGGLGVWEIGAKHPDRFAALVPVSGPSAPELADQLALTPAWAFAAHEDPIVKSDNSVQMCQAIQSHGGRAKVTQFDSNEHDCWLLAIDQSNLIDWMLAQQRNSLRAVQASGKLRSWNDH